MARKKKTYICKVCGKKYEGFSRSGTCSPECAMAYMKETWRQLKEREGPIWDKWRRALWKHNEQLRHKSGPTYERWKAGMRAFLEKEVM